MDSSISVPCSAQLTLQFSEKVLSDLGMHISQVAQDNILKLGKQCTGRVDVNGRFKGSAFLYTNHNFAVTCKHVLVGISNQDQMTVSNQDGKQCHAQLYQEHSSLDLCILRLDDSLVQNTITCSLDLRTGLTNYTVGYSSVDEVFRCDKGFVSSQDAIFDPQYFTTTSYADNGFSGAPILSGSGKVIGMVLGHPIGTTIPAIRCLPLKLIGQFCESMAGVARPTL